MKNKKNIYLFGIASIIILTYTITVFVFGKNEKTIVNKPENSLLTTRPRLEDDFYDYVNYQYLSTNQMKDDEDTWFLIATEAQEKIQQEKKDIIKSILSKCGTYEFDSINNKMCLFYDSYNKSKDEMKIKDELNAYINLINSSQNIQEYLTNIYKLNYDLSLDIVVNPSIESLPDNLKQYYFSLNALSYDFNKDMSEIYSIEKYGQIKNNLKKYDIKILTTYGYSENEANKMANNIQEMYTEIARYAIRSDKIEDKGYKLFTKDELQNQLQNINLDSFIGNYSNLYDGSSKILVVDINQLKLMDKYLTQEHLDTLKYYAIMKLLTNYSKYINYDFYKIDLEYNEIIDGVEDKTNEEDYIYDIIYNFFTDTIANEFEIRNFSSEEEAFYTNLVLEEINAYKVRIMNETWLTTDTKQKALKKMENIKYTVSLPDNLVYVENNYSFNNENTFLSNIINGVKNQRNEVFNQYKNGNILYGMMDYLEQNAYYEPNTNSINILLGWIYSNNVAFNIDKNNLESKYYDILGTIGFVMGHELSHALDSSGSKYDENGNYVNWWTDEDAENFNKLNINVVKYYNKYNQFGSTTLGENIADLGAMSIVLQIAESKNATNDDYKKIFEHYALVWCSQQEPYYKISQLYYDVHSPDKNRVNAVLSSTDKFYEIYNITDKDGMYISKENRVSVW